MISPKDPDAFYYIRYLLPSLPSLYLGTSLFILPYYQNMFKMGKEMKEEDYGGKSGFFHLASFAAIILFFILSGTGLLSWKTKYCRDCRNINEVQIELGKAISRAFPEDTRIGTIDAGAVRYFGRRFTFDLLGLTTKNSFACQNEKDRLDALVLMPAWMRPINKNDLEVILIKRTADYRVTSNPLMGRQFIAVGLANTGQLTKELDLPILSRTIRVCLKGFNVEVINRLKASWNDKT